MVNVKMTKGEEYKLEMDGHALAHEPNGDDLICASCSLLAGLFAQIALDAQQFDMLKGVPDINGMAEHEGKAEIVMVPKEEYKNVLAVQIGVVGTGFELLEHNYPDNVKLIYLGG